MEDTTMSILNDDIYLYTTDLKINKVSIQGQKVQTSLDAYAKDLTNKLLQTTLQQALDDYFIDRNNNTLAYYNDEDYFHAKQQDDRLAQLLHDLD